jgi:hypothetical protein
MAENGSGNNFSSAASSATQNRLAMRNQSPGEKQSIAPPKETVIPAGTSLSVRLDQALGSKISQSGENFSATLPHGISVAGETVVPAGASVSGTVLDAKPLGRFAGGAALQLKLTSLKVNGSSVEVQTSPRDFVAKGKGKRTAVMIGGGSGLGALIGGLAGGGKGALIGAAAGAGAGTAGTAFTGNKDVVLPVESLVSFTLTREVKLNP